MQGKNKKIAVFCGSAKPINKDFEESMKDFAQKAVKKDFAVVYGGASVGLMGTLADEVLKNRGEIIGVFPSFFSSNEIAHNNLSEMIYVESMAERKQIMADISDYFVVFPGGFGTFDEMFEILTMTQLDFHQKPLILFNDNGFYENLYLQLKKMHQEGFIRDFHFSAFAMANSVDEVFELIKTHKTQNNAQWLQWAKEK